jgi:predicted permease
VWVPIADTPELTPWGYRPAAVPSLLTARAYWWVEVMARVKDGVDRGAIEAALTGELRRFIVEALPAADRSRLPQLAIQSGATGVDALRSQYELPLRVLMGMVTVVLLIACANVGVMLLSRAMDRRREFALRLSLGASRGRLVRQLLTESLAMSLAGGVLGLLCAGWASRALLLLVPSNRRPIVETPVDGGVLIFTIALAALAAAVFGCLPALLATRVDVLSQLKTSASASFSDPPAQRFWSSTFVVVQIALSLVLLVGAGLFLRTLGNLRGERLGVDDGRVLVFGVDASQNGFAGDRLAAVYFDLLGELQSTPGVETGTVARLRLFSGAIGMGPVTAIDALPHAAGSAVQTNAVGPDFARTLGMRLVDGRDITWQDVEGRRRVALVSEAMARHFFGDVRVAGRRFNFGNRLNPEAEYEIVGVVSNAKYGRVRGDFPRVAYVPINAMEGDLRGVNFQIRAAAGDPLTLAPAVRQAVERVDRNLAISAMDAMRRQVDDSIWQERLFAHLTTAFGAVSLMLTCMGIYGTIAHAVARRRNELAVRMALGAHRVQLVVMVLRRALVLAVIGIVAGVPLSLWTSRFVSSFLFGLRPSDWITISVMALVLAGAAFAAAYLPASRATRLDPAMALKQE